MNRLLAVFTGALLGLAGCGKDEPPPVSECDYEDLDLSACDKSGLGALQAEGIWNMHLVFTDGDTAPGVIRFLGEPEISGLPISEKRVEPELFLLSSQVETVVDKRPVQYLFAGCRAPTPTQVQGVFRRCTSGKTDLEGRFDAARLTRRTGEAEGSRIELVSEIALPRGAVARDVFVAGGHAYVTAYEAGLHIFDVTRPGAPVKVAERVPTQGESWSQVIVRGQTLYIASSTRGVLVFDLSDPRSPTAPRSVPERANESVKVNVTGLAFSGNWLYAASPSPDAEVIILDATDPRSPTLARRYFVEQSNPTVGDVPWRVAVHGDRLYVSHGSYGLTVSDVANPRQPSLQGRYTYPGAYTRMAAVGMINNSVVAFEAGEGWGAHLRVLDVSTPKIITQMGEFPLRPEASISAIELVGTRLYLGHYQDGLRVLDVSNPNSVQQVGFYNTWRESDPGRGASFFEGVSAVAVPGDGYLYVTETSRGLVILREQP
jgi:hypothetical protein